ncbi:MULTISPECIES: DUF2254 domain-containing protein [unclassified Halomonas]|uniref:DUF2254 domain-containing protein n=1 Tax=unclassified Halomonas TaxID=2609666 RepID=UPI001C98247B|nr:MULTISPECIES: DUF2254 domain-containing protein [unclassified Halomonas]MBY5924493.1 DUF2254 domain-containing protein [Halomonas sp. DP4Y7-2]MBY6231535.1 DUF2254 domain-containing protein [Halomonas sp. DP4Y7-1]
MSSVSLNPVRLLRAFYTSIAYLPTLSALIYGALGLLALMPPISDTSLPDVIQRLSLTAPGSAQSLLAALLGGMISLMVFSFSMVMSVLSQAGGNFSHKLVFGLVTERANQWVLGHYLGTILFILILLIVPEVDEGEAAWRSLALYLACAMVLHCLALFVYFIHNASQSIQVDAVISGLHAATQRSMERKRQTEASDPWRYLPASAPAQGSWHPLRAQMTGYVQNANLERLAALAESIGGTLHLDFRFGDYVVEGTPIMILECDDAPNEEWCSEMLATLTYLDGESIDEHFVHGMTQMMEVAIKALSPGINDPGTARLCLHRMTDLLCRYMSWQPANTLVDAQGRRRVCWPVERFDSLLHRLFVPLLHYGANDQSILLGLLKSLKSLSLFAEPHHLETLQLMTQRVGQALAHDSAHRMDLTFVLERLDQGAHRLDMAPVRDQLTARLHEIA